MRELTRKNGHASLQRMLRGYWSELVEAGSAFDVNALEEAARLLLACQARGGTVFTAGNGGSASTASHMACDLLKGTRAGGPPTFRAMALTDNMALMTAWANDDAFDRVFAEQFISLARPGDLLVAISASGNSPNVLALVDAAHQADVVTIGVTGRDGGRLAGMVDLAVKSPADRIEVVEDLHLIVAHSLCVTVRERLRVGDAVVSVSSVVPAATSAA
ncbi:MAG: SIS domain-containing protein [Thermomicrobiales bacterium]